ncbi:MAG: UDP-glucose 4-epimerase GalE, partial [Frankiaceae bacterium]|nr:UDP-glucose 4-epimerase GalE [Frankiaceae bacterium]
MRLLVTGGAGYIGAVVAAVLLERGHQVTVLDDLSTGWRDAVPPGARFVRGSIAEAAALLRAAGAQDVDAVLHFAAKSLVAESMSDPARYWSANVGGSLALLDAMRELGIGRIVFSSTASVYGDADQRPIREDAPTAPASTYGATKLAVDMALTSYARAYGLAAVSLRYFNVAGAYGRLGERHAVETHLIPLALRAAAGEQAALSVYGEDYPTPDGTCIRDYIHVADLAEAHVLALGAAEPGEHMVLNLGSGAGHSVREVIDAVERTTGLLVPHQVCGRRAGDPAVLIASGEAARQTLGWAPARTLADM